MFPSTSPREALLVCPAFSFWNRPSFIVESTLSSPCSHSDPPLSPQGAALVHLDSPPYPDLVLWIDRSVPFLFGKDGLGVIAKCFFCSTEATLSFSAGQYVQVFPLKPAPFCLVFGGLGSTNRCIISVQLRNTLTSLGTETFGGIYPFQLHYSLTLQHHHIITILFK